MALEEAGGLFHDFGQFLVGRADLLPSEYLYELRKIRLKQSNSLSPFLEGELANQVSGSQWIHSTAGSEAFSAVYKTRPVVIEVYRKKPKPAAEKSWEQFCKSIRSLDAGPEAAIRALRIMEQFREWLQIQSDIERKRAILGNLQQTPDDCVFRFPRPVPELQSPACLAYERMEGSSLNLDVLPELDTPNKNLQVLAEGILELSLLLSLVDTEGLIENYVVLPDGSFGFRVLPAWVSVPVEWHYEMLQYVASSAGGATARALQMLCRMSSSRDSHDGERQLLSELSALQPELKINAETPESVTNLENYWRALARTTLNPPLFLHLFHRNLIILGQCNESYAPSTDLVSEALWPVTGRILRFHIDDILSRETNGSWISSSGLLFMAAARQAAMYLERLRENHSDRTEELDYRHSNFRSTQLVRRTTFILRSGVALAVFLFALQLALTPGAGAFPILSRTAAITAAVALCISVAGIK